MKFNIKSYLLAFVFVVLGLHCIDWAYGFQEHNIFLVVLGCAFVGLSYTIFSKSTPSKPNN